MMKAASLGTVPLLETHPPNPARSWSTGTSVGHLLRCSGRLTGTGVAVVDG
jgi:hypothetical protein